MSQQSVEEYERRAQEAEASSKPMFLKVAHAVVWFLYAVVVLTVAVLLLAFVLKLMGASTDAAFTRWVYRSAESMMRPFRGMFPIEETGEQSVVDVSLLFGAMTYLMVAVGFDALVRRIERSQHREQVEIANARADADNVRLQFEAQQQQAAYAAQQQAAAQQFALQQEALRRQQQTP